MGLLSWRSKTTEPGLTKLPSGSFTVDPNGRILGSTLPQSVPAGHVQAISSLVLRAFATAQQMEMPLSELVADYGSFRLTARELRGGAIVFLSPRTLASK